MLSFIIDHVQILVSFLGLFLHVRKWSLARFEEEAR
jgi:hypothetical protein